MWADNEAEVDLLGFEFLVDGLFVALTQPQLLPLTCGLLGDWGSGKSSLLKLVRGELEEERGHNGAPSYLCVSFSPWQHEGYDDVKAALMSAVLDALSGRVQDDPAFEERVSWLRRCARGFARWGRRAGRGALTVAPAAVPVVVHTLQPDFDPTATDALKATATAVAGAVSPMLADPQQSEENPPEGASSLTTAAQFRDELERLIASVPGLEALVVFVDDMDRCLPDTVVDTFEVIRVFLGTRKTAYVVAANEAIVQAAVDARYQDLAIDGVGLGAQYLEKMLQVRLRIPALTGFEADTYMNLLLAQLRLAPEQFAHVLADLRRRRALGDLDVAFNAGVCSDLLGDQVPAELVEDLRWAADVSEVLAGGLRGNPRQLKRFLNSLMLRHASARRRQVDLRRPVLAKLMVLEEQHPEEFRRLFAWQTRSDGPIPELAAAEVAVAQLAAGTVPDSSAADPESNGGGVMGAGGDDADGTGGVRRADGDAGSEDHSVTGPEQTEEPDASAPEVAATVAEWVAKDHVAAWLALPPQLGALDLRRYFAYARDRLRPGAGTASLPAQLQQLLSRLQTDNRSVRAVVAKQVEELAPSQRYQLVEALLQTLARHPDGPAFPAALDLLEQGDDVVEPVTSALLELPVHSVPRDQVSLAVRRLLDCGPQGEAVLDRWVTSGPAGLANAVTTMRDTARRGAVRGRRS